MDAKEEEPARVWALSDPRADRPRRHGSVYLAEQMELLRRRVALKLIKLGMDTREVIARFEAERQALAMMSHPNIARVYDAGVTDQGRPYFVMEYVPGVPITQDRDTHRLRLEERLEVIQVRDAVKHAHRARTPCRPEAFERAGHAPRWQAGAEDHRFRGRQGHQSAAHRVHHLHAAGAHHRMVGVHG